MKLDHPPDMRQRLEAWAAGFEPVLVRMLAADDSVPPALVQAVHYSILDGGKRLRPYVVIRTCELCGGSARQAEPLAVALECVHAFSLVHDDLPAMDNDDLRRGRPTCHKACGEAMAILAGDALLALAFEIVAARIDDPRTVAEATLELARGTGWAGMIGGQVLDMQGEHRPADLELVKRIHRNKTARLFETAGRLGAVAARADESRTAAAAAFGHQLGLAFQIADDLLDVTGTAAELGKAVAKDARAGKQTYPAAAGLEASRQAARDAADRAVAALETFGPAADDLRDLVRFVIDRRT